MLKQHIKTHFNSNLDKATIHQSPFQYLYYENVFPVNFYNDLITSLPNSPVYNPYAKERPGGNNFPDRFIINLNEKIEALSSSWEIVRSVLQNRSTQITLMSKFQETTDLQMSKDNIFETDAILIRDKTNYELSPHTDHPRRMVVLIIYLAKSDEYQHLGTSLYTPIKPGLTCNGHWHHPRSQFNRVYTAPYKPNSALAFLKTNNSFHGVESVPEDEERNLIHFFIKVPND